MVFCQAPSNDDCTNALNIPIPAAGYGLGNFTSVATNLTNASVQGTETFAPAIFVAGLDKKSVWYKFSIPTIRAVRITLSQPGTVITAGDAGFAVYKANTCLPGNTDISTKLTPIVTFGNTYHPCVPSGDYLIQVSSNLNAKGPITVQVEISDQTGAAYDHPNQAYAFGTVGYYAHKIDFNTECQSIEDATEICSAYADPTQYNKSAWLTFKTASYFDYMVLELSGTGVQSYFPSNNGQDIKRSFGMSIYKGDAVTKPISSLQKISGCDSLSTNGYYGDYRIFKCGDLDTGSVYSVQLFIKKDFSDDIRFGIMTGGQGPTKAPKPILAGVPSPNAIGVLTASPAGIQTLVDDVWACNSRHNTSVCGPALPDTGIVYNGGKFNLSSFFTFTLTGATAVSFSAYVLQCGPQPLLRVFKQGLTNNCTGLDTSKIIGVFNYSGTLDCLQPGNYTVQVSGQDVSEGYSRFNYGIPTYNSEQCLSNNLGTSFRLDMRAYSRNAANKYSLASTGAFDSINRVGNIMQPLADRVAYSSVSDTIGCQPTLRPADTTCSPDNDKVIYRQLVINDSGVVDMSNLTYSYNSPMRFRMYKGDANALAKAQNVFAFPDKITGLKPVTECMDFNTNCTNKTVCVTPGTYTFTTMAGNADVGRADKPVFTFVRTRTKHNTPFAAQNLGSLWDTLGVGGGGTTTDVDDWGCDDNAVSISGTPPNTVGGNVATKAIYRQFYLNKPSLLRIENIYYYYCYARAYGRKKLFYGKATDGFNGLSPVGGQWSDFDNAGATAGCDLLPAGWYTVVSYNQGPNYDSTFRSLNLEGRYNSSVSYNDEFKVIITPTCPGPVYNRPYKASVATGNLPHSIVLVNRTNSTPAYPRTDTTYILPTENFNCTVDTPFTKIPVKSCEAASNRVAFYVFKTTQQCFLEINTGGYYAAVYDKDIRIDSAQFLTRQPIQACNNTPGYIQFCFFQPGTYTLVVFAKDADVCKSVTPSIYIDVTNRYSRFDFAAKAYDFGVVPPDSAWHYGKVGDVNPLNSGRAPSNDIFYCTTGASSSDPADPVCYVSVNPNVYNSGPNRPVYDTTFPSNIYNTTRRNIWYTFVIAQPGYVTVKLESKTPAREYQQKFSVYRSNVDGTLDFSSVVSSGEVDSTVSQGLTHIATNQQNWYYCANLNNSLQFYRDPCTSVPTRYYILAENVNSEPFEAGGTLPNTQTEVSILIDSVNLVLPKHDHYSQAGDLGTVGVGKYQGDIDNYSCATKDATDPFYYYGYDSRCQKTLWYKFTPTITGNVRYRVYIAGVKYQDYWQVQLFRQIKPGDSTVNGLQIQGYHGAYGADNTYWAETCVSPGTYYIMITGCGQLNEYVYSEIELVEAVGDFCSRAVPSAINGPGAVTSTVLVDCHTIGTDYGEFGPQLTCPQGANTADYKSSWFRMDIGGTDTLDVTAYLVENTNAASSDIKYRLMTGDCGAMQEQSCVLDALTQNTYQCLVPGQSYYVQVFTPITKFNQQVTGTIDLKLSAVAHADTCAPLTNCLATANFNTIFDCKTDSSVKFVNFSTYGTSISYKWNFGYNGQVSTDVSPSFFYPALATDKTYSVKLVVENTSFGKKDSVTKTITVPGRPFINFGADISSCDAAPVTLKATSYAAATYTWQDGSTADTFRVSANGSNNYWVKIDYNNCSSRDTVKVVISPISSRPLTNIILCTDSVSVSASRGQGETYLWNTGAASSSIFVSKPGIYWVDVSYFSCTYRDSFNVNNVATARPLGNDTTVCLSGTGYVLSAATAGAVSYAWQDGSTGDTLLIKAPGQYNVAINFGSCNVKDTVVIGGYPAAVVQNIDTTICSGSSLLLPWGGTATTPGVYRDTLRYGTGCDSLVRKVTVTVLPKVSIGRDTIVCLAKKVFLINAATTGAVSYTWQDNSAGPTFTAASAGLYWVNVNFGSCSSRDSVTINDFPAAAIINTDTSICAGALFVLPWGQRVNASGIYTDTTASVSGCDSIIRIFNVSLKPGPALGNDTTISICGGKNFDLTASYNTTGFTTNWTIGGAPVTDPAAVIASGIYTLTAVNPGGCSDTAILTLSNSPKPGLGIDKTAGICEGNSFDLTSSFNTTGLTNSWSLSNVLVSTASAVSTNGPYQLIATNSFGCSDTAVLTLTINPKPVLGNDTAINICRGNIVDLGSFYNLSGLTPNWTINNVAVSNPAAVTGNGLYRLIALSASGCADTAIVTINFNPAPVLGSDTIVSICQGNNFNLTGVYNIANLTTNWTLNNIQVVNPATVNVAGSYQLVASNNFSCADTTLITIKINPKPVLGNDTTISICQGISLNLTTVFPSTGLTNNWTIGSAAVINPAAVSIAGLYTLIATSPAGCKDTALLNLKVNNKPVLGKDTSLTICKGMSADLTTLYATSNLTVSWTKGGVPVSNISAVALAGVYRLIASTNFGCSDTALVTLTVSPKPLLGADKALNLCTGNTIDLTKLYAAGSAINSWTKAGILITSPATVNTAGIYQLISTNTSGCADTANVTITIVANPVLVINNPATVCIPLTVNLTAATVTAGSSPALTYTYWKDSATSVSYSSPSAALSGLYFIKGTDANACYATRRVTVTNYTFPVVKAGSDATICYLDSFITLTSNVTDSPVPVTYQWEPVAAGGIVTPQSATTIVKPATPQDFIITVKDGYGCNYLVSDTVTVTRLPAVPAFAGNDTNAVANVPHQLQATGGVQYLWSPSFGLNNPAISNPLATLNVDSIRYVVEVKDAAGCTGYDTVWLRVYEGITYYIPNAFSPNGDGLNDIFKPIGVGIVSTSFFRIFNRYGQLVFETTQWNKGWDGTYKGTPQAVGNYVWVIRGTGRNGKTIEKTGNVVLVR